MSATEHDVTTAPPRHKLKRSLGPIGLLFTAVGSIIGSGWLFGAFHASAIAGPAAIFSWGIAAVMIILIGLCYAELGPMFPISGGVVRYPHLVWGSFGSYSLGFITWIASAAVPAIEVTGALTYATKFAPFTVRATDAGGSAQVLTPLGMVVAIVLLAVFVVINYFGVRLFAQINNVLVWWKLGVIALVIIVFLITALGTTQMGSPSNFSAYGFAPNGFAAVFVCISTAGITFSYLGFRQGIELAGETKNPHRNIPFALIGSVILCAILYMLLQVAFTLAVPASVLQKSGGWAGLAFTNDFGPLAALASMAGLAWLAYILYFDAVISPADTGLIYTTIASRVSYAMGRNANAPRWLASNNRHGVPHWSLVVTFCVGIVLLLPFPSWQSLVGFITTSTVMSFGSGPLVLAVLRRKYPNRPRPFRLPGGDIIPFLAFYSANMIMFWAGWATNSRLLVTILIGYVVLVLFQVFGRRSEQPPLFFRTSAVWIIPWFVLFGLVSFLFSSGLFGAAFDKTMFFWVFLINLGVSVLIYWLAVRSTLPTHLVDDYIKDAEEESELEDETIAGGHIA
ncbi:APC family permease [Microbacterium horticulturae]|uniref:APC family permease n=1 Tax=Microbacterium horticulturae TaxID=3028316 RepID=A0ABY8C2Z9_9MICO|nr:APC family permease [Microbacterium sp. KACC 23027]WEG09727.1 APC family permease [Microbacterium sp. KACC 23027]